MRFRGQNYNGEGVCVALVDSGVNVADPRLGEARIQGWKVALGATGHALLGQDFSDPNGHGTEMAAAIHRGAPGAEILAIRVMDQDFHTSPDALAAGVETAVLHGAKIINLSLATPETGRAQLLRDCCALAARKGVLLLAAAHPAGEPAYPADLPDSIGVVSHPDCRDNLYFFDPERFDGEAWRPVSGRFLAPGYGVPEEGAEDPTYFGAGLATASVSGRAACLLQALPDEGPLSIARWLSHIALVPEPDLGYQ